MIDFPTWIPDCDSHIKALFDLFLSSDASICSTMAFPPLENYFLIFHSKQDALFHCIAYYSRADWDGLCDDFRGITFFECTNRINLLNLEQSSYRLVIVKS